MRVLSAGQGGQCVLLVVAVVVVLSACSGADGNGSVDTVEATVSVAPSEPVEIDLTELAMRSGNGDPADVVLPDVPDDGARDWLDGQGAVAAGLVVATEPLWAVGVAACGEVAAGLAALGSPERVLAAASATPDPVTSELLISLHGATGRALTACGDEGEFAGAVEDFAWQWALADRRLDELGVAR